ncbi:asparaginase [Castellaniella sp. MT123]|uniref:asparaginase n=1 Tax=Castellaniella sp. MT123 TaxID=3140381 RepID=UPI0031F45CFA|nr:asparaginase [Castellaniella sp.]
MKRLPRLVLLGTGGTIASTASDATTLSDYSVTENVDALLAGIPGIEQVARLGYQQVFNVDSREITNGMLVRLATQVQDLLDDPKVDGVVITHGTDTLEESAYFLNLVLKSRKPVVFVGSMRPGSAISADGALNLYNAILLAASREARGLGVLVMLNDRFFAARFVTKMNTTRVEAFDAPDQGSLGAICQGRVHLFQAPACVHTEKTDFSLDDLGVLPSVDIVYDHQSAGMHHYLASIKAGVGGIVVAACGNGSLSPNAEEGLSRAVGKGIVCVRSSRVPTGIVTRSQHDEPHGLIASNSLNPQKARILLMLALTQTTDRTRIQDYFDRY